ncbi:PREDICTED: THAP domain-containing protein 1 A-like [Acropora digitifera]|uniref:THAP domain-containing protein 1 A-like n=1 Tax=Acropora digitifera TaxID=70779 RepID=UPI00077AEA6C|nr:PREDICTED: THAP domain-containing protein 1 A-like [Acropora digitifera]
MPDRCVVYGCSNKADPENGIGLHKIPFFGDDRKECRRRRKKWIDFVLRRRAHWKPTKHSKICSLHFRREDFSRMFTALPGQEKLSAPRLMADDVGPCVFPAIQINDPEFGQIDRSPPMSERLPVSSPPGNLATNQLATNQLATKEPPRHQATN